ncbi:hypothetical protein H8S37_04610 [Mediterraneibacter sp. NSJ-55]|uniref:Uncharacterized protein n=1 Tax=Mediterraneibacter hominis TaxID=2763054 RepID=A0A923LGB9_9FIRM|nr:hypothetical protein [Mediterraneibacter hominis]MBC5688210.1 hypothetical protein [Mediterraneibacter hominis]
MENETSKDIQNVRLDEKVIVRSIAAWNTGSARKTSIGDISIAPRGTTLLSREEIIAQAQNGNKLITGTDGNGSHATWYIEDDFTRKELTFDFGSKKQAFLTKESIKKMFELKTQKSFEDNIQKNVVTRAEKTYLLDMIKEMRFNDYQKIAFCEKHAGIRTF